MIYTLHTNSLSKIVQYKKPIRVIVFIRYTWLASIAIIATSDDEHSLFIITETILVSGLM